MSTPIVNIFYKDSNLPPKKMIYFGKKGCIIQTGYVLAHGLSIIYFLEITKCSNKSFYYL